jgi:hypothetical protein
VSKTSTVGFQRRWREDSPAGPALPEMPGISSSIPRRFTEISPGDFESLDFERSYRRDRVRTPGMSIGLANSCSVAEWGHEDSWLKVYPATFGHKIREDHGVARTFVARIYSLSIRSQPRELSTLNRL